MTRKTPLIALNYRHTIGGGITFNLTSYFGINIRRMRGSDGRMYICGITWFPRSRTQLGHGQFSFRVPG